LRKLTVLILLILATRAFAFRGRPVSDLRFDGRSPNASHGIASDGESFLVLSGTDLFGDRPVFTQKVAGGRAVGPHRQVGIGNPAGLAWTGTEYLAGWRDRDRTLWIASVSRDGTPAAPPHSVLQGDVTRIVGNGASAMVFGYSGSQLTVQPLNLSGAPIGSASTYAAPGERAEMTAGPAAGGFGVVFSGYGGTWLMSFRADGTAITGAPVLLDGPYGTSTLDVHSNAAVVATDGTDTLVVFGAGGYEGSAELKSAVVGASGIVKSTHVIHTITGDADGARTIVPAGLLWDGARYLATVNIDRDPTVDNKNIDPALFTIAPAGQLAAGPVWIDAQNGRQIATAAGWSGHELLVTASDPAGWPDYSSFCMSMDPASARVTAPARLGRTLALQQGLTIEAGRSGYLAAWFETGEDGMTVRASRIDASGNYLDGEGVVLGTVLSPGRYETRTIAIDGNGPQWLVVWSDGREIRGRTLSGGGTAGAATIWIGSGNEADVRWDGTQWVVLRAFESLYRDTVSAAGAVGEERIVAPSEDSGTISYLEPSLVLLHGRLLAVFARAESLCELGTPVCSTELDAMGLLLDTPGAVPFTIAEDVWGHFGVAASSTQALVTWTERQGLRGVLLSADAPEQGGTPFGLAMQGPPGAVAFDGSEFIVAWLSRVLITLRITPAGVLHGKHGFPLDAAESATGPVLTASATLPALVGFVGQHPDYDNVPRGVLLFAGEVDAPRAPPPAPAITCATRNVDGTITLHWLPVSNVLGISIELELQDGTFRPIAVAASDATTATVSTAELEGSTVRIRAWNAAGLSAPSGIAASLPAPEAFLQSTAKACPGVPFELSASLVGTPPFNVYWSDGVFQTNVHGYTASRLVTLDHDATLAVVSVTDASCAGSNARRATHISVGALPVLDGQTTAVRVKRDEAAALSVATSTSNVHFAWFEGARGDTTHPVGANAPTYTTPPATRPMQYWVRLTTPCGTTDSAAMTVDLNGKRRAVR
jgi:hypothetical protein